MPVIVFLQEEPSGTGAGRVRSGQRSALIQAAQAPFLQQARQLGATDVQSYRLVNAFAASVPATAVRGTLYVDDFAASMQFLSGSQLIALPYSYRIG